MSQERNPKHNDLYQQIIKIKDSIFDLTKYYTSQDAKETKKLIKYCEDVFENSEEYLKEFPDVLEIEQFRAYAKNTLLIIIHSGKADKLSPLIFKLAEKLPKDAENLYRLTSNAIGHLTEAKKLIRDYNFFSMLFLDTLKKSINEKIYAFADLHRESLVSLLATKAKNYSESKSYVDKLIESNNLIKTCKDSIKPKEQALHAQEAQSANLDAIRYLYSLENKEVQRDVKSKPSTLFSNTENNGVKSADELIADIKKMSISKK